MARSITASVLLCCILLVPTAVRAGDVTGYEALTNWSDLPRAKTGMTSHLASSYDRTGGNLDWNWYEAYDRQLNTLADNNQPVTLLDVTGSGVLTRYWMPHATANDTRNLVITVDEGLPTEAIVTTSTNPFLYGRDGTPHSELFEGPLVPTVAGGQTSYEPIGFSASLKVESINRTHLTSSQPDGPINGYSDRHYYQLNYTLYDNSHTVQPYAGSLGAGDPRTPMRKSTVNMLRNLGQNPAGNSVTSTTVTTAATNIAAGNSVSLVDLADGHSGTVRRLNVKMDSASNTDLENLRVRVRYDGKSENAVDVPIGAFFGAASNTAPTYQSLPMGTNSTDGFYCYFPMPYRDGVKIELYNAGSEAVNIDSGAVEFESGSVADDAGYFHAVYNESNPGSGKHEILSVDGAGHYVGNILTLKAVDGDSNGLSRGILEGDETVIVDSVEILQGTGLEDAYSGGFYYNHVLDQNNDGDPVNPESSTGAFSGLLWMDTVDDLASGQPDIASGIVQVSQYRWLLQDMVMFEEGIFVEIENYGGQDAEYGSTAFYYVTPEPTSLVLLTIGGLTMLRRRWARQIA